ncbi:MAG: helix-turn-helix transcriptional regulator [Phyllobacteriaceae bacterium]|nr:helix-turn-helix transcriptional regulator [Phyllobacteriaceae bacterium]
MNRQIITTPSGERLVVVPESEFDALIEAAEDAEDREAVRRFEARLATGEEELVPAQIVERLLAGENRVAVWRSYRGLSAKALADAAGIAPAYLSQIEGGKREGSVPTLKRIAGALRVSLDDLA